MSAGILFVAVVGGLAVGAGLAWFWLKSRQERRGKEESDKAPSRQVAIVTKTRKALKAKIKEAKEGSAYKSLRRKLLAELARERREAQEEIKRERTRLSELEASLAKREERYVAKLDMLEAKARKLAKKARMLAERENELKRLHAEEEKRLAEIARLTPKEAEKRVLQAAEERTQERILARVRKLEAVGQEEWERKANELLAAVVQRCAASYVAENSTTPVSLPNDDIKGRIIGKEGRNIRRLEELTGCEIVVDDTPGMVMVSGFSPLRRHICRIALEKLIEDGRIQPARIEEMVEKAKQQVNQEIQEAGETVCFDLGIADFPPKLVQLLGRLKYRTSYRQNVLKHSWEVARIAAMLAEELGADVNVVKRAALLHDIGKAVDHEVEGSHVEIGINIMKKFGLAQKVVEAASEHHNDPPYSSLEAVIVQTADAISAARPGARRESYEEYVKRLEELEGLALSFEGVEKAYAIQAGREIRVFVSPKRVSDLEATKIAQKIAHRIERELKYPGEVKVNVIRELRAEAVAR
jgi:ribonuclease Y